MSALRMSKIDIAAPSLQWAIYDTMTELFHQPVSQPELTTTETSHANVSTEIAGAVIDNAVQQDEQHRTVEDMQRDRIRQEIKAIYELDA